MSKAESLPACQAQGNQHKLAELCKRCEQNVGSGVVCSHESGGLGCAQLGVTSVYKNCLE